MDKRVLNYHLTLQFDFDVLKEEGLDPEEIELLVKQGDQEYILSKACWDIIDRLRGQTDYEVLLSNFDIEGASNE